MAPSVGVGQGVGPHRAAILKTDLGEICRYTSGTFNNNQINYDINEKNCLQ